MNRHSAAWEAFISREKPKEAKTSAKKAVPSENSEQMRVAEFLDASPGVVWAAVPNGGKRSKFEAIVFKKTGVKRGVPDCLVFTPPPALPAAKGTAFEMKKADGVPSDVSDDQRLWLDRLERLGWATFVAYGADDALRQLRSLGYK